MITSSNSPSLGSGMPNHYVGDLRHTLAISGLSHVRTEFPHLLVIPLLPPHPVESNREFPRHGYLGDPSVSSHGQVEKMAPPVGVSADRHLSCFHQQKAQQRVALFADVAQPSPIPAGLLRRHQPHIAGDLLAAAKAFWRSDDQFERQRPSTAPPQDGSSVAAPAPTTAVGLSPPVATAPSCAALLRLTPARATGS